MECEESDINGPDPVPLDRRGGLIKIASPNFFSGGEYQDNTLCEYHVPRCQQGNLLYIRWEQFNLQNPCRRINGFMCADFVELVQSTIDTNQVQPDICKVFCGQQPGLNSEGSSLPIKIIFRSNNQRINSGFRMDFQCTETRESTSVTEAFRFRRQAIQDELKEDTEMLYRGKRFVISPIFRISENCVELGGFSPPPIPTVSYL